MTRRSHGPWRALNPAHRICAVIFIFCLLNALWSLVGNWSISFGGEYFKHYDTASRSSGIYSCRGFLILSVRDSNFLGAGVLPRDADTLKPIRHAIPWSIRADLHVGPGMFRGWCGNGIINDRPRRVIPGVLVVNWQPATTHPWYNRGIAVHWTLLTILVGVGPLTVAARAHRRITQSRCLRCGYDLRATPSRCPECGWSEARTSDNCETPA